MKCNICGYEGNKPTDKKCRSCGMPLTAKAPEEPAQAPSAPTAAEQESKRPCPKCGEQVPLSVNYCPHCGQDMNKPYPLPSEQPADAPQTVQQPEPSQPEWPSDSNGGEQVPTPQPKPDTSLGDWPLGGNEPDPDPNPPLPDPGPIVEPEPSSGASVWVYIAAGVASLAAGVAIAQML